MELRRSCEALIRSQSTLRILSSPRSYASTRSFHVSSRAAQPAAGGSPAPEHATNRPPTSNAPNQARKSQDPASSMIDNLRKTSSHDRLRNRLSQQGRQPGGQAANTGAQDSLSNVFNGWQPKGANLRRGGLGGSDLSSIVPDAGRPTHDDGIVPDPPPMRLSPQLGRTISINQNAGMDVESGMRRLDILLSQNRIRSDFHAQRFYERPGMKRKRLKGTRWRMRFRDAFNHMCGRVTHLKRQGW